MYAVEIHSNMPSKYIPAGSLVQLEKFCRFRRQYCESPISSSGSGIENGSIYGGKWDPDHVTTSGEGTMTHGVAR